MGHGDHIHSHTGHFDDSSFTRAIAAKGELCTADACLVARGLDGNRGGKNMQETSVGF